MPTSLRGIAEKAARDSEHRFGNLFGLLNGSFLLESWHYLNKGAAPGVDQVDAPAYGQDLEGHIKDLVERLKAGQYHAKLVRRQYIPKGKNEQRPLGIPSVEDKLLQTGVKRILEAIYEPEFRDCSFGYRPGIGPQDAVKDLTEALQFGRYSYIVEADISGYFEHIDHEVLLSMLSERIADKPFLGLIRKWLKAGILKRIYAATPMMVCHERTLKGGVRCLKRICRIISTSCGIDWPRAAIFHRPYGEWTSPRALPARDR